VAAVQAGPNPSLSLLGYLLTRVARKAVHQLYEDTLRAQYGSQVFTARVPDAVGYIEAIAARKPVAQHKPRGAPARAIRELADEMMARIADRIALANHHAEVA
jgi:cellulose biosynthesis protein BcsQ